MDAGILHPEACVPPSGVPPRRTMPVPVGSKLALTPATRVRRVRTQRTSHTPPTRTVVGRSTLL